MTKIYITGGPGSGKTTYAKQLAKKLNIPCYDLDDVKWMNSGEKGLFNQKRDEIERAQIVNDILLQKDWICEGVYFNAWVQPIMRQADEVIILKPSVWVRQYRVFKRSLKRMLHLEHKKHKENPFTIYQLMKWSGEYDKKYFPKLMSQLKQAGISYQIITERGRLNDQTN